MTDKLAGAIETLCFYCGAKSVVGTALTSRDVRHSFATRLKRNAEYSCRFPLMTHPRHRQSSFVALHIAALI